MWVLSRNEAHHDEKEFENEEDVCCYLRKALTIASQQYLDVVAVDEPLPRRERDVVKLTTFAFFLPLSDSMSLFRYMSVVGREAMNADTKVLGRDGRLHARL